MKITLVTVANRQYSIMKTIELECRPNEKDILIVDEKIYVVKQVYLMGSLIAALVALTRLDAGLLDNIIEKEKENG